LSCRGLIIFQERKDYAAKLKALGNKAYGAKDYLKAIDLYGRALLCRQDPVFYSNRAACWNALSDWDKVIEDTTAAISLEPTYVKALNRRANAYEQVQRNSEALLDYTASCIIDQFANQGNAQSVERLLKKVAEAKGKAILEKKEKKLPSPTFVTNYLQSFRTKDAPAGLEATADLAENSGKGQLQKGLKAVALKTADGYAQAAEAFDKALELGDLGEHEAFAYNMRGTFRYLRGENAEALGDISKSLELNPDYAQSYIKRASMHLEMGKLHGELLIINLNISQASKTRQTVISRKRSSETSRIQTFTITARSFTSSRVNSRRPPRTTRSPLTWTRSSSSRTFNLV
jgi:mitochondrial import receptor subunit TOM70